MGDVVYYSGLVIDRAGDRRGEPEWVAERLADDRARVVLMWRDQCLVSADRPMVPLVAQAGRALESAEEPVLLGLVDGAPVFAADLSGLEQEQAIEVAGADSVTDMRALVPMVTPDEAGVLAYAKGLLHWNRNQRFCSRCGGPADPHDAGHVRTCRSCGKLLFPRIEPAIIVLVELPGTPRRCLMGRHSGAAPERFSTLAGFVEIGEGLEDAVRREVAEEAGVRVGPVAYQASQSWPFPAGIMLGFRAQALSPEIAVDGAELEEARWFTPDEIRARISGSGPGGGPHRVDSIDKFLIEGWLSEGD